MQQVYLFKFLRSPLTSAALLSHGLTNMTGSPPVLTRSQRQAHPSSCALRIIVGADDGVVQDLVPDDDALFGSESADPTSGSDSTSTGSGVEEDEPTQGHGLLMSRVRAKVTMIAMMTEVTILCRLPTMMDRNSA